MNILKHAYFPRGPPEKHSSLFQQRWLLPQQRDFHLCLLPHHLHTDIRNQERLLLQHRSFPCTSTKLAGGLKNTFLCRSFHILSIVCHRERLANALLARALQHSLLICLGSIHHVELHYQPLPLDPVRSIRETRWNITSAYAFSTKSIQLQ
jgi:hypothetical protein